MEKILLHCCCAVCFNYPFKLLCDEGFSVVPYFYNPNIYPKMEHDRRFSELKKINKDVIFENYCHENFLDISKGLYDCPERGERCLKCFELRLLKSALKAKELGISKFTTTLTVSPHKNSAAIFSVGEKIANKYNLEFVKIDFKKHDGFKITQKIASDLGLYKQTYCGCEFSMR